MKLNLMERLITNSPLRAFGQRHVEGPLLRAMARRDRYPLCLEIGCGRGVGARVIVELFGADKVIATDVDPEQIERAERGLPPGLRDRVVFKKADAMALDEPEETFDAVFSFGVIHHMEDWRRALGEIARVTKTGGEFFFEELLRPFLSNALIGRLTRHPEGGMFTLEEFREALKGCGMEMTALKRIDGILVLGVGKKLPVWWT
jgi:ubiquinone/menaquinone biosynthesis C-methylase UbiE